MYRFRLYGLFLLLGLYTSSCIASTMTPTTIENLPALLLDTELKEALDRGIIKAQGDAHIGVSAAVLVPGYQVWTGSSGNSSPGSPISVDMVFDVGSVAKNLEAALVLQLAEQGKLSLDDPVSHWLPPLTNVRSDITIRQLLNHTSGVFNVFEHPEFPWVGPDVDYAREWRLEEVFDSFVSQPYFPPGEGQYYSSTNYLLLTKIVELAGEESVEKLLEDHFIKPYGLDETYVTMSDPPPPEYIMAHPWADINRDGTFEDLYGLPVTWKATLTHPVIYATPRDMVDWLNSLYYEQSVLSERSLNEMLSFPRDTLPDIEEPVFGLGVADYSRILATQVIGHAGSSLGYSAAALYLPENGTSVVWMLNTGESPEKLSAEIMRDIWDELFEVLTVELRHP